MSDGFNGAGLLSWQLATDRLFDGIEAHKDAVAARQNAQNVYDYLQSQIDQLRHDWYDHAEKAGDYCDRRFARIEQQIAALQKSVSAPQNPSPRDQSLEQQLAALKADYEQLRKQNDLNERTILGMNDTIQDYLAKAREMRGALINTQDELRKLTGERRPDPPMIL